MARKTAYGNRQGLTAVQLIELKLAVREAYFVKRDTMPRFLRWLVRRTGYSRSAIWAAIAPSSGSANGCLVALAEVLGVPVPPD